MNDEFFWDRIPFFRLLIPFLGGIIFQIYLQMNIPFAGIFIVSLFVLIVLVAASKKISLSYRFRSVFGFLLAVFLFISGIYLVTIKTENRDFTHFSKIKPVESLTNHNKEGYYYVRLDAPYLEKDRSLKVVMDILSVKIGEQWLASTGKAMFYIQKDSLAEQLHYGDCILVKTNFADIPLTAKSI